MYFTGDKLFWFLKKDGSGRRLLKVNSSQLRRTLLKKYSNRLLYKFKVHPDIFNNRPEKMSISALWRFRRVFTQFLFSRFFYKNSPFRWHLLSYASSYFLLRAILHYKQKVFSPNLPFLDFPFFFNPFLESIDSAVNKKFYSLPSGFGLTVSLKRNLFTTKSRQSFLVKEHIAREQLRARLYWVRKAHNKHNAATYRPKRFYLFLGEQPRKNFRQLYVQPHSSRNKAALKLILFKRLYHTRSLYKLGNFFYLFKFLTLNFLSSSFFFLPKNRLSFFVKFFLVNNEIAKKPFLSPGDFFSVQFSFWPIVKYFFFKKFLFIRWSKKYRLLYNYAVQRRIRRRPAQWNRLTRFFQKFALTWDPFTVLPTSHIEFSFLIFSGLVLKLPSKYLFSFRWN